MVGLTRVLFMLVLEAAADTDTAEVVLLMPEVDEEMIGRVSEAEEEEEPVTGMATLLLAEAEGEP